MRLKLPSVVFSNFFVETSLTYTAYGILLGLAKLCEYALSNFYKITIQ